MTNFFNLKVSGSNLVIEASLNDSSNDSLSGETLTAIVQRTTDSFYWNNTTNLWQASLVSFTVVEDGTTGYYSTTMTGAFTTGVLDYFITYQESGTFNYTTSHYPFSLDTEEITEDISGILTVVTDIQTQIGTAGDGLTDLGGMSSSMQLEINSQIVDVLFTDTIPELSAGQPVSTPTIATGLMLLYMGLRNENTTSTSTNSIKNDAGTTIAEATVAEVSEVFTFSKFTAP